MKFHEFTSWWDLNKARIAQFGREYSYAKQIEAIETMPAHELERRLPGKKAEHRGAYLTMLRNEARWYENRRPYYKVYPCVVDALCRLKLEFNCPCPKVPEGTISIRFAEGHEPEKDGNSIAALLVYSESGYDEKTGEQKDVLFVQVALKENPAAYYWFYFDTNTPDMTIEECLNQNQAVANYEEVRKLATRIALTTCMLAHDPDIITPEVLAADQTRYDKEKDEAWKRNAERKARNKGVLGWSVGKNIEVTPHIRRPHWALRHTGPNRSIPKVVPVKGCKVKARKLTEVPTGYVLPDGTEVEDGKPGQD